MKKKEEKECKLCGLLKSTIDSCLLSCLVGEMGIHDFGKQPKEKKCRHTVGQLRHAVEGCDYCASQLPEIFATTQAEEKKTIHIGGCAGGCPTGPKGTLGPQIPPQEAEEKIKELQMQIKRKNKAITALSLSAHKLKEQLVWIRRNIVKARGKI